MPSWRTWMLNAQKWSGNESIIAATSAAAMEEVIKKLRLIREIATDVEIMLGFVTGKSDAGRKARNSIANIQSIRNDAYRAEMLLTGIK